MAFLASVAGALSGLGAVPGAQPEMNSLNNRTQITVAPVGVNIGAIMQPYTENPVNGGLGLLTTAPRFSGGEVKAHSIFKAPSKLIKSVGDKTADGSLTIPLLVGGGLIVLALAAARG